MQEWQKEYRSLVIVGGQGSGKSLWAKHEAHKIGPFVVTDWRTITSPSEFDRGAVLASSPAAVVVDDVPATRSAWWVAKCLAASVDLEVQQKGQARRRVRAPVFIFTCSSLPPIEPGNRRFKIIDLTMPEPQAPPKRSVFSRLAQLFTRRAA